MLMDEVMYAVDECLCIWWEGFEGRRGCYLLILIELSICMRLGRLVLTKG
jgi:hypothetical protein